MSTDTRDRRAIEQIACPVCGAKPGSPCLIVYGSRNVTAADKGPIHRLRPLCHLARRKANQERLRELNRDPISTNPLHKGNPK